MAMTARYQRISAACWWERSSTCSCAGRSGNFLLARETAVASSGKVWPWILANSLAPGRRWAWRCFQLALLLKPTGVVLPIVALTPLVIIPFSRAVEGERPHAALAARWFDRGGGCGGAPSVEATRNVVETRREVRRAEELKG